MLVSQRWVNIAIFNIFIDCVRIDKDRSFFYPTVLIKHRNNPLAWIYWLHNSLDFPISKIIATNLA